MIFTGFVKYVLLLGMGPDSKVKGPEKFELRTLNTCFLSRESGFVGVCKICALYLKKTAISFTDVSSFPWLGGLRAGCDRHKATYGMFVSRA